MPIPYTRFAVFIAALVLALSGCAASTVARPSGAESIRVLVMDGAKGLTISGVNDKLRIEWVGRGRAKVNGAEVALPAVYRPRGEFLNINGKPYRGTLTVGQGRDGIMVVNELEVEAYVAGIINNEISSRWPKDAIRAQAVVARTYAVYQKKKRGAEPYHVEATTMGQVYNGAGAEDAPAVSAVRDTAGEMLFYGDEPALTVYHSNAGGMTEDAVEVWGSGYPYLRPVKSPYDEAAPKYAWEFKVSPESLRASLRAAGYNRLAEPTEVAVSGVTASGRVKAVAIKDANGNAAVMSGEELRRALGYGNIKSAIFKAGRDGGAFVFNGRGSGHGVGLSQWGAKGMAGDGYSYKEILNHYYPGTELVKRP
ncbi:MAG: SpoIID/LytB domain-containing protein [Deltaproteobacteria bacterium]|nr:SpoIID/LytB domain-containing protein [Deltaproteobacteria bacterium]